MNQDKECLHSKLTIRYFKSIKLKKITSNRKIKKNIFNAETTIVCYFLKRTSRKSVKPARKRITRALGIWISSKGGGWTPRTKQSNCWIEEHKSNIWLPEQTRISYLISCWQSSSPYGDSIWFWDLEHWKVFSIARIKQLRRANSKSAVSQIRSNSWLFRWQSWRRQFWRKSGRIT